MFIICVSLFLLVVGLISHTHARYSLSWFKNELLMLVRRISGHMSLVAPLVKGLHLDYVYFTAYYTKYLLSRLERKLERRDGSSSWRCADRRPIAGKIPERKI